MPAAATMIADLENRALSFHMPGQGPQMAALPMLLEDGKKEVKSLLDIDYTKFLQAMKDAVGFDEQKHEAWGIYKNGHPQKLTYPAGFLAQLQSWHLSGSPSWSVYIRDRGVGFHPRDIVIDEVHDSIERLTDGLRDSAIEDTFRMAPKRENSEDDESSNHKRLKQEHVSDSKTRPAQQQHEFVEILDDEDDMDSEGSSSDEPLVKKSQRNPSQKQSSQKLSTMSDHASSTSSDDEDDMDPEGSSFDEPLAKKSQRNSSQKQSSQKISTMSDHASSASSDDVIFLKGRVVAKPRATTGRTPANTSQAAAASILEGDVERSPSAETDQQIVVKGRWEPEPVPWGEVVARLWDPSPAGDKETDENGLPPAPTEHLELVEDTCKAFRINIAEAKKHDMSKPWVKIPGLKTLLYFHQALGLLWMFRQAAKGGGCLAEPPGMGKTFMMHGLAVLYCHFVRRGAEIERARAENDSTHHCIIPWSEQTGHEICPTDKANPTSSPMICQCLNHNITSKFYFKGGATLMFIPSGLLRQHREEWEGNIDEAFPGNPRLYIAHNDTRDSKRFEPSKNSGMLIVNGEPQAHAEENVVLTTVKSYLHQVLRKTHPAASKNRYVRHDNVTWGLVMRDESHTELNPDNLQFLHLRRLNKGLKEYFMPILFWVTGTPLSNMVASYKSWVLLLRDQMTQDENFRSDEALWNADAMWFQRIKAEFAQLQRLEVGTEAYDEGVRGLAEKVNPFIAATTLRHSTSTRIFGQAIVRLPPQEFRDVNCDIIEAHRQNMEVNEKTMKKAYLKQLQKNLETWRAAGSPPDARPHQLELKELLNHCKHQRILTNIPGLYELQRTDALDLTWTQIQAKGWSNKPKRSPYYLNIDALYDSSSKLQALWKMQSEVMEKEHGIDKLPQALVVLSEFPVEVFIIDCLYLKRGRGIATIAQGLSMKKRASLIRRFMNEPDPETQKECPADERVYIVQGTMKTLSMGYSLHRAHIVVIMEPTINPMYEEQGAKRVSRLSQTATRTTVCRLVTKESKIESMIMQAQHARVDSARLAMAYLGLDENSTGVSGINNDK